MELIPGLPDDIGRECLIRVPYTDLPNFFKICTSWKTEINSTQFHSLRKAATVAQSLILLTQADDADADEPSSFTPGKNPSTPPAYHLTLYDPETGSWARLPAIPGYPDGLPLFCHCSGIGRYLVVIAGWNPTSWKASTSVYIFDFVSATWKRGADMPGPARSFFSSASDSDHFVFVAGGHDDEKTALRSAFAYNVVKDVWLPLPDMATERDECKAVFHSAKFHVISGYCTERQGEFEKDVEVFDVATWKWCHVGNDLIWQDMGSKNCVTNDDAKLFRCFAGNIAVLDGLTWREVAELPANVRVGPFMLTWHEKILVIGSNKFGGAKEIYMLEFIGEKGYNWIKVETPKGFSGNIQAGCRLQV